jgi:hypothetical protein
MMLNWPRDAAAWHVYDHGGIATGRSTRPRGGLYHRRARNFEAGLGEMMSRTTIKHCDRCGSCFTDLPGSIISIKAGCLVGKLPDEVDVCPVCCDSFLSWLRSGKPHAAHQAELPTSIKTTFVPLVMS